MSGSSNAGRPTPAERVTYLYTLSDPRDDCIRYLGKTVNPARRYYMHLFNAGHGRDTHKDRWIRTVVADDAEPVMNMIEEVIGDAWQEREVYWIETLRAQGCDLTNVATGGRGVIAPRTAEWKQKIGEAHRGKAVSQAACDLMSQVRLARSDARGCKNGHPWTIENTLYRQKMGRPYRQCRICISILQRSWRNRTGRIKGRVRTTCKRGHLLDGDNLRILMRTQGGSVREERICRTCVRIRNRDAKRRARRRQKGEL